jgi:hypothetical protein
MGANFPGGQSAIPGVYSQTTTIPRGVSNPTTPRIAAIIGQGQTTYNVALAASGGGKDGLDPTYTYTSGQDGRHFLVSDGSSIIPPYVPGTTSIYKNSTLLNGIEMALPATPTANPVFPTKYNYAFDPATGRLLMQASSLEDQGGSFYTTIYINSSANKGASLINLSLINANAPQETWYIRCVGVQRNNSGIIPGTAQFVAIGSVSGQKYDANGNPYVWTTLTSGSAIPTTTPDNTVIAFDVVEGTSVFEPGDQFIVYVTSQILSAGDNLIAYCTPTTFINAPVIYDDLDQIYKYHGQPSTTNTLSLGAQMAWENGASSIYTCQAAPPLPARQSFELTTSMVNVLNPTTGVITFNNDDFLFPLPETFVPALNTEVNFFITSPTTGVETQILPNQFSGSPSPSTSTQISEFISGSAPYTGANTSNYCYTVIPQMATTDLAFDGTFVKKASGTGYQATFSSASVYFDSTYVGKWINVIDSGNVANINFVSGQPGSFLIQSVVGGAVVIDLTNQSQKPFTPAAFRFQLFTNASSQAFSVLDQNYNVINYLSASLSYTDGVITSVASTDTATLASVAGDTTIAAYVASGPTLVPTYVKINTSANGNNGTFAITNISGLGVITLKKMFVNETGMRFTIVDPSGVQSYYVLVNEAIVPNGYALRVDAVSTSSIQYFDVGWENAFTALEKINCDVVVALPNQTITAIFQNNVAHCAKMSATKYKKERLPIIGAITGLGIANVTGSPAVSVAVENIGVLEGIQGNIANVLGVAEDLANYSVIDAYGSTYRCVYLYPDLITKTMLATGTVTSIDGYFAAASLAGWLTSQTNIQEPPTNKTLVGFTIPNSRLFSTDELELLQASGICILQPTGPNACTVIDGFTTTQSGAPEEQEISVVMIRDQVSKSFRGLFKPNIGREQRTETQTDFNVIASTGLDGFKGNGWITAYQGVSVQQDKVEPRQWNIKAAVQPSYGITWIWINVAVGYLTGN